MQNRTCRSAREVGLHRFGALLLFLLQRNIHKSQDFANKLNTYRWWQVHILTSHTLVDLHDVIASGIKVALRIVIFGNEYLVLSTIVNRDQHGAHIRESVGMGWEWGEKRSNRVEQDCYFSSTGPMISNAGCNSCSGLSVSTVVLMIAMYLPFEQTLWDEEMQEM